MFPKKWNLNDPKDAEEALNYFHSLPDDEVNSDAECDSGAEEELNDLDREAINESPGPLHPRCTSSSPMSTITNSNNSSYSCDESDLNLFTNNNNSMPINNSIPDFEAPMDPEVDLHENNEGISTTCEENDSLDEKCDEEIDTDWTDHSEYFHNLSLEFEKEPRTHLSLENNAKEISSFQELFDDHILQFIVDQSNLYAQQQNIKNWNPLSLPELKAFMGCLVMMGIHQVPRLENYWSSDPLLGVKCISDIMSSKRFKKITQALHLNDNTLCPNRESPDYDKLYKVKPVIDYLNKKCLKVYECSSFVSVDDESMIPFKGRSSFKQFMPQKPVKRGYKVWCLADSKTGFISKFEIYTGKSDQTTTKKSRQGAGLGERVVLRLTKHLKNNKCLVAFDNFFTSASLERTLFRRGIYSVGTVRGNRSNLPEMFKENDKMNRGEFMFKYSGVLNAVKWQDKKAVNFLTTAFSPEITTTVTRTNKDGSDEKVYCPKVVYIYNVIMGGVDRFDQLRERYAIGRRSVKWWYRIFYFLLDLGIVNGFILYQISKRTSSDQLAFRIALARQLINSYSSRKRRGKPVQFLANKRKVPDEVRLSQVGTHFPEKSTYRRCRMCSTKKNEKRTSFICSQCKVPACVPICFRKLHQKSK